MPNSSHFFGNVLEPLHDLAFDPCVSDLVRVGWRRSRGSSVSRSAELTLCVESYSMSV